MLKVSRKILIGLFAILACTSVLAKVREPVEPPEKKVPPRAILTPSTPISDLYSNNGDYVISWDANVPHLNVGYILKERINNSGAWTEYKVGKATRKLFTLKDANVYDYIVYACNSATCSMDSDISSDVIVNVALPESPDDGTIGNIDDDENGIRDDVEVQISALYPNNPTGRGYLEHTAYYFRLFLLSDTDDDVRLYNSEVSKGYECLKGSDEGEHAYASVLSTHLDSRERFRKYNKNQKAFTKGPITVGDISCVLSGTGVEPISACSRDDISFSTFLASDQTVVQNVPLLGENVKITIEAKNEKQSGNSFKFAYFLNGIEQEDITLEEGKDVTWVIDNYLLEDDGLLRTELNSHEGNVRYSISVSCEPN